MLRLAALQFMQGSSVPGGAEGGNSIAIDANKSKEENEKGSNHSSQQERPQHGGRSRQKCTIGQDWVKEGVAQTALHHTSETHQSLLILMLEYELKPRAWAHNYQCQKLKSCKLKKTETV